MTATADPGQDLIRQSKGFVNRAVEQAAGALGERIAYHVGVARDVTDVLRERGEQPAAGAVEYVANKAEDVAYYLREHDVSTMLREAENLFEKRGWLLAGVGFLTGIMASRGLRAAGSAGRYAVYGARSSSR